MTARFRFLFALAGLSWGLMISPPARAQAIGPEFRVNSWTEGGQTYPSVAAAADGRVIVTWESYGQDGSSVGVFGQRYGSDGLPAGPEFRVNSYTSDYQGLPSVAVAPDGRFVVAWMSYGQDGSSYGVFGQRYDSDGLPAGPEFRVNSYTTSGQRYPSVAAAADGRFVVTWESSGQDGSGWGVFGQRYDSDGLPAGTEFRVSSQTAHAQYYPAVAAAADGRFVVTWESYGPVADSGVFGQRYDSDGLPAGPEFRINSATTGGPWKPSVAVSADGRFVVTWMSGGDGSDSGVSGQRYGSDGLVAGPEFRVNSYTTSRQTNPSVAVAADGRFVVAWMSYGADGSGYGVSGRRFHLDVIFADGFEGG
jgi:hypothetical protein